MIIGFIGPVPALALVVLLDFALITAYHRLRNSMRMSFAWMPLALLYLFNFIWIYPVSFLFDDSALLLIVPLALLGLLFHWIQSRKTRGGRPYYADAFLACLWFAGIIFTAWLNVAFGTSLVCLHIALILVAVMLYWRQDMPMQKEKAKNDSLKVSARLSFTAILLLSYFFPFLVYSGNEAYCNWQNSRIVAPLIEEIEAYNARMQRYPYELSELNTELPNHFCQNLAEMVMGMGMDMHIMDACGSGTRLYVGSHAYNFRTKEWENIVFDCVGGGLQ